MPFDAEFKKLTGATPSAVEKYREAMTGYQCFTGNPIALLEDAITDAPGFVMGHVLKAWVPLIGSNAEMRAFSAAALHDACVLPMNSQEEAHVTALSRFIDGEIRVAARILEDVSIEDPHDLVALQVGQMLDFLLGDSRMLRDRIGRALPQWDEQRPGYHAVLGMHAFGLEEMGHYARSEAAGRRAIELEPRNSWAQHAVAHVMEMQDRRADGVAWMMEDVSRWAEDNFFSVHNWWHLALFHLGLGQIDEVLHIYDGPVYGQASPMEFDMVDASAMLWRLNLMGVDVGERWTPIADSWQTAIVTSDYGFNDFHAAMAFVGAGRSEPLTQLVKRQRQALFSRADNATFVAEVAADAVQAVIAFGEGDYATSVEKLRPIRNKANRFGGSHAQRDLIDLTLIEAAKRSGQEALARALTDERAQVHPR